MNKLERIKATLNGEPVDRPPYSFWTHLPGIDLDPQRLAAESATFAKRYDIDVLKSMPNGLYCVEDWGCECDYSDIARGGVAKVVVPAVQSQGDWKTLQRVDVTQGSYGRELRHLSRLVELVGPGVPVLATVFSPLTIAAKLSNGASREHLASDERAVIAGLETIAQVTCDFSRAAIERGCAGVFLAMQEATCSAFTEADYRRFGEPYDSRVIQVAKSAGGWFNAVHAHGEDILFDVIRRYDVEALNWHIGETPPSIADYRASGGAKPILGGLQRAHITNRNREGIAADIEAALAPNGGKGVIVAPACVIRHPVDDETLRWTAEQIKTRVRPR
ncbi:MAG TPA: uroporphyrinogen decarboxylase family protein [Burkholderiales bacterium]|nr:uroporphyrinogen decarboxylase family protein [Burkholderiales bacterium]